MGIVVLGAVFVDIKGYPQDEQLGQEQIDAHERIVAVPA